MRLAHLVAKILCIAALVSLATGCSLCKRKVKSMGENIAGAENEGILKDVHFAFDSSQLDATARAILEQNAAWLKENGSVNVGVEGHCDERGTVEYNMALGMRRARSTVDYMRSLGIAESRMTAVSYGKENPLDPGHNEVAWAKNRRAHFKM